MKKNILMDMSPLLYSNLFSATNEAKKMGVKKTDGKYHLDEYKDIVIYKIFDELSKIKTQFDLTSEDEIILAFDNSKGGYWRKDVWAGYKSKRRSARDDSNIQWDVAFELFQEIRELLDNCSSFKCISIDRVEADDIIFVLSKHFSLMNEKTIIVSVDHDFIQCLEYDNVDFYRTKKSQAKEPEYYEATPSELTDIILEHCIQGDPGDGFGNIKAYSRFSKEFLKVYPQFEGDEKRLYPKRFEIENAFRQKYNQEAYNHPRYGYKMFLRSKKTVEELLEENEIYAWNYEMNRRLALPDEIPSEISEQIIKAYEKAKSEYNYSCLYEFLMKYNLFESTTNLISF
jgi:hypothetical protein